MWHMLEQSRDLGAYSCSLPLSFQEIVYLVLWGDFEPVLQGDFGPECIKQHSFKCETETKFYLALEKRLSLSQSLI